MAKEYNIGTVRLTKAQIHLILDALRVKTKHLKVKDGPTAKAIDALYVHLWEYETGQSWLLD